MAKSIKLKGAQTKLERAVQRIVNDEIADYDDQENAIALFMEDLDRGGCVSGMIGALIYYADTVKFYRRHRVEIDALLAERIEELDMRIDQIFKQWDKTDPLAREDNNLNLLAWFGFETVAYNLAVRAGVEW